MKKQSRNKCGAGRLQSGAIVSRRQFIQSATLAGSAVGLFGWPVAAQLKQGTAPALHRWFPQFPPPRELWLLPATQDVEQGMVLESAAGLAAAAVLARRGEALICEEVQNDGYRRWLTEFRNANSPRVVSLSLNDAIERLLKDGTVRGYILFRFEVSNRPLHSAGKLDESANVATSLASTCEALVVSERLAETMQKLGLKQLMDVRDRSELWCLSQQEFSRRVLGTADPKTRHARSMMIALNAFVCAGRGDAYDRALARCDEDVPVLGWGCEAEDRLTIPSSRWGLFQTATDWCLNLPVFASDRVGESIAADRLQAPAPPHWSTLDWGDGSHHVNFTLTDGDNVQWMMSNFAGGSEAPSYYGNPRRGTMPFTWGLPVPSLCQLSPRTLVEILAKATPKDDFIDFNGAGYFYPDLYGKARATVKSLELHAERLRGYMELTGIRILAFNFQDWDGAEARAACELFAAKLPGLLGIFAFQYYPYSAGNGSVHWVKGVGDDEVPVVSCRLTIWANTGRSRDTTPAGVAAHLNGLPALGETANEDSFSWVLVHAWSRFRRAAKDSPLNAEEKDVAQDKESPDTARGYDPALWAMERLGPKVKPVTARELLWRIRLRLRPQATLAHWLAEVEGRGALETHSSDFNSKIAEARNLLRQSNQDQAAGRRCFELLKTLTSLDPATAHP